MKFKAPKAYKYKAKWRRLTFGNCIGHRRCLLFAFTSLSEGFGLPLIEAMGFGYAVVAAKDAALYVQPRDVLGWASMSRALLDKRKLREKFQSVERQTMLPSDL